MASTNDVPFQLSLPTSDILELSTNSLGDLVRSVGKMLIQTVMETEVDQLLGKKSKSNSERKAY